MRTRIAAVIVGLIVLTSPAWALDNEPKGFRGIEWGTPVDQVRAKVSTSYNAEIMPGVSEYRSRSDLTVNGIPLTYNLYQFYKGRFSTGIMEAYSQYCGPMLQMLRARFGAPDQKIGRTRFLWHGKVTTVVYVCSRKQDYSRIAFQSAALIAEIDRDLAESARRSNDLN